MEQAISLLMKRKSAQPEAGQFNKKRCHLAIWISCFQVAHPVNFRKCCLRAPTAVYSAVDSSYIFIMLDSFPTVLNRVWCLLESTFAHISKKSTYHIFHIRDLPVYVYISCTGTGNVFRFANHLR